MAYLGNDLQVAYPTYRNIDDISGSFNSSTTSFPLLVNGAAPVPPPLNSQQCLISVGGVVQRPDDSGTEGFRLSGGNIIFASAPSTGADFFGVILAGSDYVNVGANFPSGSAAVPSITFDADLDTGIYNPAANELGFSTAGVLRFSVSSAGQLSNNLGTAGAPSYTFTGDVNTGLYSPGADQIGIATGGSLRFSVGSSGVVTVKNGAVAEIGTLTDGATITPNFAANCNFTVTLGGNRSIANPTNLTAGQSGSIFLVQDATGGRTVTWGSYWDFPAGAAPTLSSSANAVDRVDYVVRSSTSIHTVFTANYS